MNQLIGLIFLLFISNSLLSQNVIPSIELKEVTIENSLETKENTIGFHKSMSLGKNLFKLEKGCELALELNCKSKEIYLKKIHLNFDKIENSNKILIVRIREKDSLGIPNEILFEKKIKINNTRNRSINIDVPYERISLNTKEMFLTLKISEEDTNEFLDIPMTKSGKKNTYILSGNRWRILNSPISKRWNVKFGITYLYEK